MHSNLSGHVCLAWLPLSPSLSGQLPLTQVVQTTPSHPGCLDDSLSLGSSGRPLLTWVVQTTPNYPGHLDNLLQQSRPHKIILIFFKNPAPFRDKNYNVIFGMQTDTYVYLPCVKFCWGLCNSFEDINFSVKDGYEEIIIIIFHHSRFFKKFCTTQRKTVKV